MLKFIDFIPAMVIVASALTLAGAALAVFGKTRFAGRMILTFSPPALISSGWYLLFGPRGDYQYELFGILSAVFTVSLAIAGIILLSLKKSRAAGELIWNILPSLALSVYTCQRYGPGFLEGIGYRDEIIFGVSLFIISALLAAAGIFILAGKIGRAAGRIWGGAAIAAGYASALRTLLYLASDSPTDDFWPPLLFFIALVAITRVALMLLGEWRRLAEVLLGISLPTLALLFMYMVYSNLNMFKVVWGIYHWHYTSGTAEYICDIVVLTAFILIAALAVAGSVLRLTEKRRPAGTKILAAALLSIEAAAVFQIFACFFRLFSLSGLFSGRRRYGYIICFLIIIIALTVSGVALLFTSRRRTAGKLILSVEGSVAALYVINCFYHIVNDRHLNYPWAAYVFSAGLLLVLAAALYLAFSKKTERKIYIPAFGMAALLLLSPPFASAWDSVYKSFLESVPNFGDDQIAIHEAYFDTDKLASLPAAPALSIGSDIPRFGGEGELYPLYGAVAKAIYPEEAFKDSRVLNHTGSYKNLIYGNCDIFFAAVPPSDDDMILAGKKGVELTLTPAAREALVFFVNSENPLDDISSDSLRSIFSGKIKRWSRLGIKGFGKIRAYQPGDKAACYPAMREFMGELDIIEPHVYRYSLDTMHMESVIRYRNYENAISFSLGIFAGCAEGAKNIKPLSVDGVYPSVDNVKNNTYPLRVTIYAVTTNKSNPKSAEIIEWILSGEGQRLIEAAGFAGAGD